MWFGSRARLMVLAACTGQVLAGCTENTPEHLDFSPGTATFYLTTDVERNAQWRVAPRGYPKVVCAGPQAVTTDCCSPPGTGAIDCQRYPISCDADNFCALTFDVDIGFNVDLLADMALVAVDGRALSAVSLVEMSAKRTIAIPVPGVAPPPIRGARLFVAPKGVATAQSPDATLVAWLPLGDEAAAVVPTAEGQQAFSRLARDYRTPFTWLLSAHFVVPTDTAPAGSVTIDLTWRARGQY